jgi:hypothetical protein
VSGAPTGRADADPPSSASASGLELPVLESMRPLAAFAVLATVLGRALAKALTGSGVGGSRLVEKVVEAGAVASQIFALAAMMLAILTVMAAARSRLPLGVRLGALTLGGFAILPTVWALHEPVPDLSAVLVGGSASLLALVATPSALRAPFARGPALVLGLVALGSVVRLGAVALVLRSTQPPWLAPLLNVASTAAFLADTLALAAAIGWIAARSRRLTSPASMVLLALALLCTRQALAGRGDDLRPLDVMLWRVAQRLTSRPDPAFPLAFQVFVAFLGPMVASAALLARGALGPLGAAVALALCARGSVEMPPCALMLMIAALGLALAAGDGRGLWAAIGGASPARGRGP